MRLASGPKPERHAMQNERWPDLPKTSGRGQVQAASPQIQAASPRQRIPQKPPDLRTKQEVLRPNSGGDVSVSHDHTIPVLLPGPQLGHLPPLLGHGLVLVPPPLFGQRLDAGVLADITLRHFKR